MEEIAVRFDNTFSRYKGRNIILYGLGENTKFILKDCRDFHFLGVLDGYCTEGEFNGVSILNLSEINPGETDAIIIVARAASTRIIWNRIKDICINKGIPVYNLQGECLTDKENNLVSGRPEITVPLHYVHKQIEMHDVISFDIFDTLLKRRVPDREEFFRLIARGCGVEETSYAGWRMRAELVPGNAVASLDEIYEWLAVNADFGRDILEQLKEAELEKERENLFPYEEGRKLLQYASELGKVIYLVSDMYLGRIVIEELLCRNGINGYKDIYISCEYGTGKRQGLFEVMMERSSGKSFLHIGDSEEADGNAANCAGIDAILIDSSKDGATFYYPVSDKYRISSAYQLGYTVLAPIMSAFCEWLLEYAVHTETDCILFLARDGYVFHKMYEIARKKKPDLPEGIYFMFSRSAGSLCYIENEEKLRFVAGQPFSGDMKSLIIHRFGVKEEELLEPSEGENAVDYAARHQKLILENAAQMRNGFQKYFSDTLHGRKKILLIDFVSTGSCQFYLEGIERMRVQGVYFMHLKDNCYEKQSLRIESFIKPEELRNQGNNIENSYFLLEQVIKATTGTVIGYSKEGEPFYGVNHISEQASNNIDEIQQGILDYYAEYIDKGELFAEKSNAEELLLYFNPDYAEIKIDGAYEYTIYDVFTNRESKW